MFEVGKKVVCIDSSGVPETFGLKQSEIYHLNEIKQMECCGGLDLDIGLISNQFYDEHCACGKYIGIKAPGQRAFFSAKRFRPIDYAFADKALEQIFEQELILP